MAGEDIQLMPWALTDLESARDYMNIQDTSRDVVLLETVNRASAAINRRTRRMLREMPYTNPVTVANINGNDTSTTITTTDDFNDVRERMTVSGTGVKPGTFVVAIVDSTTVELNIPPEVTPVTETFTFTGLGPSILDGLGTDRLIMPEYPTNEIISISAMADDGGFSTMDPTGHRSRSGVLVVPQEVFPEGSQNVYVEHMSGFRPGVHDSQLEALESACLRLVQVMMLDRETPVGRGTGVNVQGFGFGLIDSAMPKDIAGIVDSFKRWV